MTITPETPIIEPAAPKQARTLPKHWYFDLLMILVILTGGYFRFVGIKWDENQHLHPDERFMTMVENEISPVHSIADYFNTDQSSLNPHNRGLGFYVYGISQFLLCVTWQNGQDKLDMTR